MIRSNMKWMTLAVLVAALGAWSCGDSGGGGEAGGICDEESGSYDALGCLTCFAEAMECLGNDVCEVESKAVNACSEESCTEQALAYGECTMAAYGDCVAAHPGDEDAFDDCMDSACSAEESAKDACVAANCHSSATKYVDCFKRDCPEAAACIEILE